MYANSSASVPADISFEQAIALTENLLHQLATDPPEEADLEATVAALVQTANGARGFFVTALTSEFPLVDPPSPALIRALQSSPSLVADLLVKNLAMSTAMEITHRRNQQPEMAQGSARVQHRTIGLLQAVAPGPVEERLQSLNQSLGAMGGEYQDFLQRWGYDEEQRQAIAAAIATIHQPENE